MTWFVLNNASPGATRNSGTNGDLCTLLDWALPQAAWSVEYSATNARVYRPGTGNRFRLFVQHDSSVSGNAGIALVRGCEDATGAAMASLTDTFPLVSQVANNASNWFISSQANTTDREFTLQFDESFIIYASKASGIAETWDMGFFGDVPSQLADAYNTIISVRNVTNATGFANLQQPALPGLSFGNNIYWARDISGATKSSRGVLAASGSTLGGVAGAPGARGGYQNRVYRERVGVSDAASTTLTPSSLALLRRGYLPHVWSGIHNGRGTLSEVDTFTDVAYNPAASFRALSSGGAPFVILEESDTWTPP